MTGACPNCGAALAIDQRVLAIGRVACQACSVRCDVMQRPAAPGSPFRERGEVELLSEPPPPDDDLSDRSGEQFFRHVYLRRRNRRSLMAGLGYLVAGVMGVGGLCGALVANEERDRQMMILSILALVIPALVLAALFALFRNHEEVWIADGELRRRRGPLVKQRAPLTEITEVAVVGDHHLHLEVRGPRPAVEIGRGLGHGFESMQWLARHLQDGVDRARARPGG